jgi:hypothetical protein
MDTLADLFKSSLILRGIIALTFTGTVCYMYLNGQDVPEGLQLAVGTIIGFFFAGAEAASVRALAARQGG